MFCPACISSTALVATGIVSTGGAGALLAKLLRAKNLFSKFPKLLQSPKFSQSKEKSS